MGILPLQFKGGQNVESLRLAGQEVIDIIRLSDELKPRQAVTVKAKRDDGSIVEFMVAVRIDTPVEYDRTSGTAKRADGVEEVSAPLVIRLRKVLPCSKKFLTGGTVRPPCPTW